MASVTMFIFEINIVSLISIIYSLIVIISLTTMMFSYVCLASLVSYIDIQNTV